MSTKTVSESTEIIQNNLEYTLFSWSKQKGIAPIAVKYAEGVYLYDYDDKKYIDFSSGLMNVNIGHFLHLLYHRFCDTLIAVADIHVHES